MTKELWIAVADAFFSVLTLVLSYYLAPDMLELAISIIAVLQPLVIALIAALVTVKVFVIRALATCADATVRKALLAQL